MEIKNATESHYVLTPTPKCDSFMSIWAINTKQSDLNIKNPPGLQIKMSKSRGEFDLSGEECMT